MDAAVLVRKHDNELFIGTCSSREIERLEKYVDEPEARPEAPVQGDPRHVGNQILADLHHATPGG